MKIDINNIHGFELENKFYLSNNVFRFNLDLKKLYDYHLNKFEESFSQNTEYKQNLQKEFSEFGIDEKYTIEQFMCLSFRFIFSGDYYYSNGQDLFSLIQLDQSWQFTTFDSVFGFSIYLSEYYPFNIFPFSKKGIVSFKIFEQSEQKIYQLLNEVKVRSIPIHGTGETIELQEVYPENYIVSFPDDSKLTFVSDELGDSLTKISKSISEKISPNRLSACINCKYFKFSGMSSDMSGGQTGYCFYVRDRLEEKSVVESITQIWNKCHQFELT